MKGSIEYNSIDHFKKKLYLEIFSKIENKGIITRPKDISRFYEEIPTSHLAYIDRYITDEFGALPYIIADKYYSDTKEKPECFYKIFVAISSSKCIAVNLDMNIKAEKWEIAIN